MDEVRAVLRRRAEAVARRRAEPPAPAAGGWVFLSRGGAAFAVEASLVAEVARLEAPTPLPGLPGWLDGIAPYRGRILAVYGGTPRGPSGPDAAGEGAPGACLVAVLADGARELGIRVDAVDGMRRLPPDAFRSTPAPSDGLGRWASGLGADGTLYLDGARMLADPSLTLEDPM